jgi:hypothetical protein
MRSVIRAEADVTVRRVARSLIVCLIMAIPLESFSQSSTGTVMWGAGNGYPPGPYSSPDAACAAALNGREGPAEGWGPGAYYVYSDAVANPAGWDHTPIGGYPYSGTYCNYAETIYACGASCPHAEEITNGLPYVFAISPPAKIDASAKCDDVPADILRILQERFTGWKIQATADLSTAARERWGSEKPPRCPGIASGIFNEAKAPSYAALLIPIDRAHTGFQFVIFSPRAAPGSYEARVIEQSPVGGENVFIRTTSVNGFFDAKSRRKFHALAKDAVLFVNAGKSEYETDLDLYFFANGAYRHEPVDH